MEQQDLLVSVTIDQDFYFPGEASQCNTFSIELSRNSLPKFFFTQGHFSAFDFSIKVSVKSLGILTST